MRLRAVQAYPVALPRASAGHICAYKNERAARFVWNTAHVARRADGCVDRSVSARARCAREISREWAKKCDEDKQKLDNGLSDLKDQLRR